MKYGVIYYKDTDNIGDDIQTYAAYKFLPRVDYCIDREHMSDFVPDKKEFVKVIANGWYNHDKSSFLFSPYIYPLMVSMHFSKNDLITNPGYTFLDGYAKEKLKWFEPIGCRDENTAKELNKLGYKTFFSACLTMTIDPIGEKKEEDYICAVDLKPEVLEHLKSITDSEIREVSHWLIFDKDYSYEEKRKIIEEYTFKSFEDRAKYVEKNANLSFEERMKNVEDLLKVYQNAKLVITDRIHVALPCLALGTPVLLIFYEHNSDRIETFKQFLVNCTEEDFFKFKKEDLEFTNKKDFVKYRNKLKKMAAEFVLSDELPKYELPDIDVYKDFVNRTNYIKDMYKDRLYVANSSLREKEDELKKCREEKENEFKKCREEKEELRAKINELSTLADEYTRIKGSKTWKIIGKYYDRKLKKKS